MLIQNEHPKINQNENLKNILDDIKNLSLVQSDINDLLNSQDEYLKVVDNNLEKSFDNVEKANVHLNKAISYKTLLKPIVIGSGIGIICSLPISIPICLSTSVGTSLIGYSCLGGGIIGGIGGKMLS